MAEAVNKDVLAWARRASHLTVPEVAQKMGLTPDKIESWETGDSAPSYPQLEKLAYTLYKRPIAIFFFPFPPKDENIDSAFRTIPENYKNLIPNQVMKTVRKARFFQLCLQELFEVNPDKEKLTQIRHNQLQKGYKAVAVEIRQKLGITIRDQIALPDLKSAVNLWQERLEQHGVFVFKDAFRSPDYAGFSLDDPDFPIIYINNSLTLSRQLFTIAHEFAHLVLSTSGMTFVNDEIISDFKKDDYNLELQCNYIASYLLLPDLPELANVSIKELSRNKFAELDLIANKYKISREVVLRRLYEMQAMTTKEFYELRRELLELSLSQLKAKAKGGDFYRTKNAYLPKKYVDRVFSALYQNKITSSQAAEYLTVKSSQLSRLESVALG
jgi:Zn-dependent peptidase ImmA (M78 family)/transcriptional regulator with XRE-family HTH domain